MAQHSMAWHTLRGIAQHCKFQQHWMTAHGAAVLQVYLASASPPVRHPNVYGVDMPTKKEFVATDLTEEEIRKVSKDWPERRAQPILLEFVAIFAT